MVGDPLSDYTFIIASANCYAPLLGQFWGEFLDGRKPLQHFIRCLCVRGYWGRGVELNLSKGWSKLKTLIRPGTQISMTREDKVNRSPLNRITCMEVCIKFCNPTENQQNPPNKVGQSLRNVFRSKLLNCLNFFTFSAQLFCIHTPLTLTSAQILCHWIFNPAIPF